MQKPTWFKTLNDALQSEQLLDAWPVTSPPMQYNETRSFTWEDGSKYGRLVSIYRDERGLYERPIHYKR
jgi:hypothetical protein